MSMSDDVSSAALQVSMKAAETSIELGGKFVDSAVNDIAKLLRALMALRSNKVKSTDLTNISTGEVSIKKLIANAKNNNDSLSTSEHGLTKADKKYITRKAKEYGIPVAFTGKSNKDNIYANVRAADLPILERICTEMMKDKLAERPQELGNFKIKAWEMPFISSELNKHDLSAQFGKTQNGEYFCLYEKVDEKAILIARSEFIRKCNELNDEISLHKDDDGFYSIKDLRSGREITFDTIPSREDLSRQIQSNFGYDENKSNIVCAKFGEEHLQGEEKHHFFSNNPQNEFSRIDANIELQGESIYVKDYTCWRLTHKSDGVPKIVYRDNEGNFAVLNPKRMTRKEMSEHLRDTLKITDKTTLQALVDKAEKVSEYYATQENISAHYEFSKSDFDMTDPEIASGMLRTDEAGNTFTKALPVSSVSNSIERIDKDSFSVSSTAQIVELDQAGTEYISHNTQSLVLSFSDKKNAIHEMTELYKKQGVPAHTAHQMAKETFKRASTQSAEKVLLVEEIKADIVTISHGSKSVEIDITDRIKAKDEISKSFGVTDEEAEKVLEKADEKANPQSEEDLQMEDEEKAAKNSEAVEREKNGHEKHDTDILKNEKPEAPNAAVTPNVQDAAEKIQNASKVEIPASRGKR